MLAGIDLGTNSARLLVGEIRENKIKIHYQQRITTRLGKGLKEGTLQKEALARTRRALGQFNKILSTKDLRALDVFTTSSGRRANNIHVLDQDVKEILGQELRILSGDEEGVLSYQGAIGSLRTLPHGKEPIVLDIGGGSTEICGRANNSIQSLSVELGAVGLTEKPLSPREIQRLLGPIQEMFNHSPQPVLVGVGGTITSLAAMAQKLLVYDHERITGYELSKSKVEELYQHLASLSVEERASLPGLEADRAPIILAGVSILINVLQLGQMDEIIVSDGDLLLGALQRLKAKLSECS